MDKLSLLCLIFAIVILLLLVKPKKENYRDPIYLNRSKFAQDYYPRSNGSIYGHNVGGGGSWTIFSGHPQYPTVY